MKKLSTEQFIERCNKTHGDRFDYSLVEYINNDTKVKIICKLHGIFLQNPKSHLNGIGCSNCSNKCKKSLNNFINEANTKHKNKYNYSLVQYINNTTKIKIICPIHGEFNQTPKNHLKGGCDKCSGTYCLSTNDFINKSKEIHNEKYDYSISEYINNRTKIKIICKEHGIFLQTPDKHLIGHGCPICKDSKGEIKIRKFLEKNNINFISQYKFDDCRNINQLPFDFYLPNHNICIEYDGIQHFEPIEKFGGETALKLTMKRDKIKNEYCIKNNIRLIRIPYYENFINYLKNL